MDSDPQDPRVFVVPRELHGLRGSDALPHWLGGVRRSALRQLLRDGLVLRNGTALRASEKLRAGDVLMLEEAIEPEDLPRHVAADAAPAAPDRLYEDAACLALDKPPGLATVPGRHGEPSVKDFLVEWFGDADLRVVHRLDRETSGVLLFAKGLEAARAFDAMFRERRVAKRYLALVRGTPKADQFTVDLPIGRSVRGGRVRTGAGKGAREATTEFEVVARFRGFALLEARPLTGRQHQIRVHLASCRLPLAVDRLYGRNGEHGTPGVFLSEFKSGYQRRRSRAEQPLIDRLTLHASEVAFASPDPAATSPVLVRAPLPKDLRVTLQKLDQYARADVATAQTSRSEIAYDADTAYGAGGEATEAGSS